MAVYNLSAFDDVTNLQQFMSVTNVAAEGWIAYVVLSCAWLILILTYKKADGDANLFGSSLIMTIASTLFYFAEWTNLWPVGAFFGMTLIFLISMRFKNR